MDPVTDRNNYTVGRMESVELEHPSEEQYGVIVRYPAINHRFWGTIGGAPKTAAAAAPLQTLAFCARPKREGAIIYGSFTRERRNEGRENQYGGWCVRGRREGATGRARLRRSMSGGGSFGSGLPGRNRPTFICPLLRLRARICALAPWLFHVFGAISSH
jgi:hypothetical protein